MAKTPGETLYTSNQESLGRTRSRDLYSGRGSALHQSGLIVCATALGPQTAMAKANAIGMFAFISVRIIFLNSYFPPTENASKTFPGALPTKEYPELAYSIPPTMTAPGPSSDPR